MAELRYLDSIQKKFGWTNFPFSLDLVPEIFAGKEMILNPILEQLAFGSIVYIEGNYGSGKSQILKHINYKLKNDPAYARFIPVLIQEPLNTEILIHSFKKRLDIDTRIERIGDLTEELEDKLSGKRTVILLVDEAQEMVVQEGDTPEIIEEKNTTLQWIRVLSDFQGCKIFLAGLTNFGKKLNEMFRPLEDRVTLKFFLKPMDLPTTIELIKERIRYFSDGSSFSTNPFSDDAFEAIHEISGGYPRAILRLCQDAVIDMLSNGRESIDGDRVYTIAGNSREIALSPSLADAKSMSKRELEQEMKTVKDQVRPIDGSMLNSTEQQVMKYMAAREEVTPQGVADACNITSGTAANILRKLKEMGYSFRKRQGRTYSYTLFSAYRREFTQA
jgi:type II secretory pathway predicted ATPase ExeA/ribosomal protein S25